MRAFKTAKSDKLRLRRVSVGEVRETLRRRATLKPEKPVAKPKTAVWKMWARATKFACFRGFSAYLIMAVSQWYLAVAIDFFLSGQPSDLKLGYGSTSIVLATLFGPGFAVWTHYAITEPSRKRVWDHFPRGNAVLNELWPMTACWAICEHLTMSGPLALSRSVDLKRFAFDMDSWNTLDQAGQNMKIAQFGLVLLLYAVLVTFLSVPATITIRRVYASMLSDEDLAVVPFHVGDKSRLQPYNERAKIRRPGLTVSAAFASITWEDYLRVLLVYLQYFALNQFIQLSYWSANWKLHEILEVDRYTSTNLPCSPVGKVLPFSARSLSPLSSESPFHMHTEL